MSNYFSNEYFPQVFATNARFKTSFRTEISRNASGIEQRKAGGYQPTEFFIDNPNAIIFERDEYSFEHLKRHYNVMQGQFCAFRFRCVLENYAKKEEGYLGKSGKGTGFPTYQLYKKYIFGNENFRKIALPVQTKVYVDDVLNSNVAVDSYTGIVSFQPLKRSSISSVSTSGRQVTFTFFANHNFVVNELVYVNITSKTNYLYNKVFNVIATTDKTISIMLEEDVSIASISSTNSYIDLYPQSSNTLRAEFNFDFAVRYDSELEMSLEGQLVTVQTIKLVEVFDDLSSFRILEE